MPSALISPDGEGRRNGGVDGHARPELHRHQPPTRDQIRKVGDLHHQPPPCPCTHPLSQRPLPSRRTVAAWHSQVRAQGDATCSFTLVLLALKYGQSPTPPVLTKAHAIHIKRELLGKGCGLSSQSSGLFLLPILTTGIRRRLAVPVMDTDTTSATLVLFDSLQPRRLPRTVGAQVMVNRRHASQAHHHVTTVHGRSKLTPSWIE